MKISASKFLSRLRSNSTHTVGSEGTTTTSNIEVSTSSSSSSPLTHYDLPPEHSTTDDCIRALYPGVDILVQRSLEPLSVSRLPPLLQQRRLSDAGNPSPPEVSSSSSSASKVDPLSAESETSIKQKEEVLMGLHASYFETCPSFDRHPITLIIQQALNSSSFHYMELMESLDSSKDAVMFRLGKMINNNKEELMKCMKDIQTIDSNLKSTLNLVSSTQNELRSCSRRFEDHSVAIIQHQQQKKRLTDTINILKHLKVLKDSHYLMKQSIQNSELYSATSCGYLIIKEMSSSSSNSQILQFDCMKTLLQSVRSHLGTIRTRCEEKLTRVCSITYDQTQYGDVVKCYLLLDEISEMDNPYLEGCLDKLHEQIQAICDRNIEEGIHVACLEVIYLHLSQPSLSSSSSGTDSDVLFSLSTASFAEKCKQVDPSLAVACIARAVQQMVTIVHTYQSITTWHHAEQDWSSGNGVEVVPLRRRTSEGREKVLEKSRSARARVAGKPATLPSFHRLPKPV